MLNLAAIATPAAPLFSRWRNESIPKLAALCAAICLALTACAQPPPPQPAPPALSPTSVAPPSPTPRPAPAPATQPTRAPATQPTPAPATQPAPSPVNQPMPAPTAQPTPTPTPPPTSPPADVAFTQIAVGKGYSCGLRENGAILCWGRGAHSALPPPAQTGFRQISAGRDFTCALRQDQTIACWGNNARGRSTPPQGSFSEIAAGASHTCALPLPQPSPPALLCWGGAFPNGAEPLPLDAPISDIQSGAGFTCGLTPQADMACLSINTRLTEITPGPFTQLEAGVGHICALRQDGSAFCQGDNYRFQATPPTTKFAQIAAGWHHSCGITRARRIECWGIGRAGSPGERLAAPDGEFAAITIGYRNSCAIRSNRRAVCWITPDYLPAPIAPEIANLSASPAFGGAEFQSPVDLLQWQNGELAVVEQRGVITAHRDQPDPPPPKTILDISHAGGMLSAALDPRFEDFPFLYVWYSAHIWRADAADNLLDAGPPRLIARLARFRVERGIAIRGSELAILNVHISNESHIGGAVRFGADGMLYLGIGDNGNKGYPQALNDLRGKIIRIDVRGAHTDKPYGVPPDNPFVDNPNARPEIWAYGLRNPWRMAFDPANPHRLFVADVGESTREEVSIATPGANLGWPLCEADLCQESLDPAIAASLTPPAVAYGRDLGCAVIGGVTVPWLNNAFIFGNTCYRRVWLMEPNHAPAGPPNSPQTWRMRQIANLSGSARSINAFAATANGSLYALPGRGAILRLRPDPAQ